MTSTIIVRPGFGRVLAVVMALIAATTIMSLVVSGGLEDLRLAVFPTFVAFTAWLVFWDPAVVIGPPGVTMRNVFRTTHVPWSLIDAVDTRWALTLEAGGRRYSAWAAPAPGRHNAAGLSASDLRHLPESAYSGKTVRASDLPRTDSGDAATIIRQALSAGAGGAESEGTSVTVSLHTAKMVAFVAVASATALAFFV